MKHPWIWAVLGVQLVFFTGWALREESLRRSSAPADTTFLLATEAVDPRDMFAGQYMTLRYPASRLSEADLRRFADGALVRVRLVSAGNVTVGGKQWPLRQAEGIEQQPGQPKGGLQGFANGLVEQSRVSFGIERYYFNEDRSAELNALKPGSFYVLVTLSDEGTLKIKDLIY